MKRKTFFLLSACLLSAQATFAQNEFPCATDHLHQQALQNPAYFKQHQALEQEAFDYFSSNPAAERGSQVVTIPLVVHIIHDNGPENLSDAQVQQAIAWLNQAFANQGYYDQGSGADAGIQFCLAKRTPDSEPTNGITRNQSPLTELDIETEQLSMKNLNRWKPKEYVNIWLVKSICSTVTGCGVSAYAYYPSYHGGNLDGIVAEFGHFTSPAQVAILAHEMGHYFGLRHTFEGGCSNGNCLTDGDKVCDTPPDQSTAGIPCGQTANTCSTDTQSGFATDQPDMTTNFVDYGNLDCLHDFTDGQGARMNFFLNGARKSLLASKGCLPPCPLQPTAAFSPGDTTILAGQTLLFDNASQNAVTFAWTINATPFGGQQNAAYFFDSAGVFTIKLVALPLDALLCDADSAQVTVQVLCPVKADFTLSNLTPEAGQTIFITNNSQNANAFEWFVNGVSQGATLDSIVFTESGSYDIRLVAKGGFCNSSAVQVVFVQAFCESKTFILGYNSSTPNQDWEAQSSTILTDGSLLFAGLGATEELSQKVFFIKMKPDGTLLWTKLAGRDSSGIAYCPAIAGTPDGGFVALIYQVDFVLDRGNLAKFSADGVLEWVRLLPPNSSGTPEYRDLIITPDSGIIVGVIAKFDLSGNLLWHNSQSGQIKVDKTALMQDGSFVTAGRGSNGNDIARYDADGNLLWYQKAVATGDPLLSEYYSIDIAVDSDSNIFVLGARVNIILDGTPHVWLYKLKPNGELLWSKRYFWKEGFPVVPQCLVATENGITIAAKYANSSSTWWTQACLLHTDLDGNIIWIRQFATNSYLVSINSLNALSEGGYLATLNYLWGNNGAIRLLKADKLGYAGQCPDYPIIIQSTNFGISVQQNSVSTAPQPDFPFDTLPITDFPITLDTFCAPACPQGIELCNNNLDDDGDGLFDCLDPDCDCAEDVCHPKQANIWYFGNHAGLDFSTEPPTVLTDGAMQAFRAAAVACDKFGNLLFYSNGDTIYNRFHEPMPNGAFLNDYSDPECIAVPHPGDIALYYLFTTRPYIGGLNYSLIDMRLDGGRGDVVSSQKGIGILQNDPKLTAISDCTSSEYWLLAHGDIDNKFYAYKIDENGLNSDPVVSPGGGDYYQNGQMKFSPKGNRIARANKEVVELYDFNTATGLVSNPVFLTLAGDYFLYGLEFSPNGRYLYASAQYGADPLSAEYRLTQIDLETANSSQTLNSLTILASGPILPSNKIGFGPLQLAPNGKIYINNLFVSTSWIHIIHQPNLPAPACQFQENGLSLAPTSGARRGLVNVPQNLFAEPASVKFSKEFSPDTICDLNQTYFYKVELECLYNDSISWKMEGLSGTLSAALFNAFATFDAPGTGRIIVTAYTECGIVADTLHIVVAEPFDKILDLGPDQVVCDNGVVTLNAGSGFARYRWQNGSPDSVLTTLLPGKYWVDVWDACGNQQTDTVNVSVAPATVLDLGLDREGCPDLTAIFQRPDFFSHWLWSPADFLSCDTCQTVTVSPASTTIWIVVAQTDDGCISVDTLTFEIQDTLFFQLDTSVCIGQTIDLFGVTLPPDTTAQFFFPNPGLGCDTLLTVNVLGLDAPFLEIEETICANAFFNFNGVALPADTTAVFLIPGAGGECDSIFTVTVNSWPPLTVTLPPDTTLRIGATLILNAETSGTGALTFAWSPAEGLSCTNCSDTEAAPLATTLYSVQVADANGCSAQDSMLVVVDTACNVIIPNAFSPNGDGVNDWFYPRADPCVPMIRTWRVVSRWGEIIFEKSNFSPNDPTLGWDGNRSNGEPFPSDVLVWYAELEYFDGKKEVKKGDIALLR